MNDNSNDTRFGRQGGEGRGRSSEFALPPAPRLAPQPTHAPAPQPEQLAPVPDSYEEPPQEPRYEPNRAALNDLKPSSVPKPPSRSQGAKGTMVRFFNFLLTLAFFGSILFVGGIWYGKTQFEAPGPLAGETTFVVPKGASFSSIVPGLEEKGIIQRQGPLRIFLRGVRSAGKGGDLKAGEFAFQPGMSMKAVMEHLTEGRSIQYTLGFPEGWTSYKMMERIAANEVLTGPIPPMPAEGALMPDTYSFQRGMTRDAFVQLLKDSQQKVLRDIWNSRVDGLPLKDQQEMVILASIVEKETGVGVERPQVASVFINRLRKGMRLQTDPTVIYGIWGGQGKPKDRGGLRRSELDKPTPYNTYLINGLPPGPIANPGRAALEAVANPANTDYLYFVADGTGGHVFSKTLAEHNANVKKWRVIEAQRKKEAEAAARAAQQEQSESNDN